MVPIRELALGRRQVGHFFLPIRRGVHAGISAENAFEQVTNVDAVAPHALIHLLPVKFQSGFRTLEFAYGLCCPTLVAWVVESTICWIAQRVGPQAADLDDLFEPDAMLVVGQHVSIDLEVVHYSCCDP